MSGMHKRHASARPAAGTKRWYTLQEVAAAVPITISVSHATRNRLEAYRLGVVTFDDVLNALMDAVPVEEHLARMVQALRERVGDPPADPSRLRAGILRDLKGRK